MINLKYHHARVWRAIEKLAEAHGHSPSSLAKLAGLDPTSFNVSKRISQDGRMRWPNSETVAKVLLATGAEWKDLDLYDNQTDEAIGASGKVPLIGMAQAGNDGYFDDGGFPVGGSWEDMYTPGLKDKNAYALEISGDSMLPLYREGDIILVSPNSEIRRGDRVVLKTKEGEVLAKEIKRRSIVGVTLASYNPEFPDRDFTMQEIDWIARIIWASQ